MITFRKSRLEGRLRRACTSPSEADDHLSNSVLPSTVGSDIRSFAVKAAKAIVVGSRSGVSEDVDNDDDYKYQYV